VTVTAVAVIKPAMATIDFVVMAILLRWWYLSDPIDHGTQRTEAP